MKHSLGIMMRLVALLLFLTAGIVEADGQVSVRRTPKKEKTTTQTTKTSTRKTPTKTTPAKSSAAQSSRSTAKSASNTTPVKRTQTTVAKKATPKNAQSAVASDKTVRQQAFDEYQKSAEFSAPWQRVVYRELDVLKGSNASLYYPQEPMDGMTNFFRTILDLLINNKIKGYEYLDGREVFAEKYEIKVKDLLDKFQIMYELRPPTTRNAQPVYYVDESDVPSNEVLSYYIKERWEFNQHTSQYGPRLLAICPVLHRAGDFGGDAVRYPMCWINYEDLRPFLRDHMIMSEGMNNAPRYTMEEFFALEQYEGEIYKVQNLRGLSLMQQYPNPDTLKMVRARLEAELRGFSDSIWVNVEEPEAEEEKEPKARKRSSRRTEATDAAEPEKGDKVNRRTKEVVDVEAAEAEESAKAERTGIRRSVRR